MAKWNETPRSIALTIKITPEQKEMLIKKAEEEDVKVSYLAYQIVSEFLDKNVEK